MPIRTDYADHGDACVAAHALDLVGDRWTAVVMRELMYAPRRFTEVLEDVHGITPAVLTARLRFLTERGLVTRTEIGGVARYVVTPWGREFEGVLQALARWAHRSPALPIAGGLTPNAAIMAMRTMAPADRRVSVTFDLALGDARRPQRPAAVFGVRWTPAGVDVSAVDAVGEHSVSGDSTAWAGLLFAPGVDAATVLASWPATGDGRRRAARLVVDFRRA